MDTEEEEIRGLKLRMTQRVQLGTARNGLRHNHERSAMSRPPSQGYMRPSTCSLRNLGKSLFLNWEP